MITLFTEEDLLSFGQYMISPERKKSIMEAPEITSNVMRKEILKSVVPFDYQNWVNIRLSEQENSKVSDETDDEKEIFELVWSEDEYKKIIESNMLSLPNPNNRIKYPKF